MAIGTEACLRGQRRLIDEAADALNSPVEHESVLRNKSHADRSVNRREGLGPVWHDARMLRLAEILIGLVCETLRWFGLSVRSKRSIKAENLFLRRQLALYIERGVRPRRIDCVTRIGLTLLSRFFNWRDALVVVRPATLIRWHRAGWQLLWRLKSRPGRPPIPLELQALIRRIASENPLWGEERIANELLLKIGIRVSPRTVSYFADDRSNSRSDCSPNRALIAG